MPSCVSVRAFAALPVDSAVLDGEAVVLRPDQTSDFEALRSPHGQAAAVLVVYDLMEVDGHDVRAEVAGGAQNKASQAALPEEQTHCLTASSSARRSPETATRSSGTPVTWALRASSRSGSAPEYVSGRTRAWLKTKNPNFERRYKEMCGRVIQSSEPLAFAIVDGMDVRDSRLHNHPPRWNAAPSQELLVIRRNHKIGAVSLDPLRWV